MGPRFFMAVAEAVEVLRALCTSAGEKPFQPPQLAQSRKERRENPREPGDATFGQVQNSSGFSDPFMDFMDLRFFMAVALAVEVLCGR